MNKASKDKDKPLSDWSPRELECKNCLKSLANGGNCEDLNCEDYPCPSQEPKPQSSEYNCPDDCTLKGNNCPIGVSCPPLLVRDNRVENCPYYPKPVKSSQGCSFCGNPLTLLMENGEYRLWACQPLKGREGCGRLLLEDAREHLGATWYLAEQNEPDRRR